MGGPIKPAAAFWVPSIGRAERKVAVCFIDFGEVTDSSSLGGGRKPPPSRRLPEHPQVPLVSAPLPGASSPEQLPSPGPAVPLKELESELRMMVTQDGRGGHLHWPVARAAARKEVRRPTAAACVRTPSRGRNHRTPFEIPPRWSLCDEVTPHNEDIQGPPAPAGLGPVPWAS